MSFHTQHLGVAAFLVVVTGHKPQVSPISGENRVEFIFPRDVARFAIEYHQGGTVNAEAYWDVVRSLKGQVALTKRGRTTQ